jgi:hypothetical protein
MGERPVEQRRYADRPYHKKYSLAPPVVSLEMEGTEWGQEIYFNPAKKVPISRSVQYTVSGTMISLKELPEFFEGDFEEGQKEIVIRKRIPVTMDMQVDFGNSVKLLTKKEFLDFYLVLRKAPFAGGDTKNKPASTPEKPATTEPEKEKTTEAVTAPATNPKKKPGLDGVKNKVKKVNRKQLVTGINPE